MKNTFILLLFLSVFSSCEKKYYYSEFKPVDSKNWEQTDTLTYLVDIDDSNAYYDIFVSVRHQKDYEFSNIWLNIIDSYYEVKETYRLQVPLFKQDGKPYGKESGSLCTQTIPFQKRTKFPKSGNYKIKIVQLMRKEPLNGISDVGIIIEKKQ